MLQRAILPIMGFLALGSSQVVQVQEAPPPPVQLLNSTKSGVLPQLPTQTPFTGIPTLQGAIISPVAPQPGYTGLLGTATAVSSQPAATYRATFPGTMFNPLVGTVVSGSIEAVAQSSGTKFTVNITNLPDQAAYGPFNWHIHTMPVPANGNCTATLSHFDPTNRGEYIMCDAAAPETCQVGDLAGKHGGKITTPNTFYREFVDAYLSTQQGSQGFFGGLSFVLHSGNTTRITCANFVLVGGGGGNGTVNATATSSGSLPVFTGAADKVTVGMGMGAAVVGAVVAAML